MERIPSALSGRIAGGIDSHQATDLIRFQRRRAYDH